MNLEDDILIERFLNKDLSSEEKEAFLKRMEVDPTFKEHVLFEKQLSNTLNDDTWSYTENQSSDEVKSYEALLNSKELIELKEVISKSNRTYKKSTKSRFKKWILYSSAAIIAVLLSIYVLFQQYNSPQDLYVDSIDLSNLPSLVTRGDETNNMLKAQQLFEAENYKEALTLFSETEQNNATILLYKGIAEMQLDKFDAAEATFNNLIKSDYLDAQKGYWYKALMYLKKGNIENARLQLSKIVSKTYYNYENAKLLLDKL